MKVVVVGSGLISKYDKFLKYIDISDFSVCCDGGMKYFYECGIVPNIIIGDLDSAELKYIEYFKNLNVEFKEYPKEKDYTDMELGLLYALGLNADEIFIFGGTGSRFDHSLTNAHILKKASDNNVLAWLIDEHNKICVVKKYIKLSGKKGTLVSIIPFTTKVLDVTTKGLKYSLSGAVMEIGNSLGVSNVMIEEECEIFVGEGLLFAIISED